MAWKSEIYEILKPYMAAPSDTGTAREKTAEAFLEDWFGSQDYFREHPEFWGLEPTAEDGLDRHVVWGMVKGEGDATVVMVHHYDVVDALDFGAAMDAAYDLDRVHGALESMVDQFDAEARADFEDENWIFGRGGADMKAGGAMQMALLRRVSREAGFSGNLILCCLPDEENMSAGMRAAVPLLARLKEKYNLDYRLMIDSEPHEREKPDEGILYQGSVGKLMPLVYARGRLAHSGRIFEGLNALNLISQLVVDTELNMAFSEGEGDEVLPPPAWLYARDGKTAYDVSIPVTAGAYMNLLTLGRSPGEVLALLKASAERAFDAVLERMNRSHAQFCKASGQPGSPLPWKRRVVTFDQLIREIREASDADFDRAFQDELVRHKAAIDGGESSYMDASFALVEWCLARHPDKDPVMVLALSPPYYTPVCNTRVAEVREGVKTLGAVVDDFTRIRWNQPYTVKNYFTGICDLSYAYPPERPSDMDEIAENMPLWGRVYDIPFGAIRAVAMPSVNIGPWGKDLHKLTERVHAVDLYQRTPAILDFVVRRILADPA